MGVCLAVAFAVVGSPLRASASLRVEPEAEAEPEAGAEPEPADDMQARAMAAYERGQQNYNLAQYEAALADFKEASSLFASPDFQYNIALCYEKLGRYEEAILAYGTYLKAKPDASDRANVEANIQRLRELVEKQKEAGDVPAATPPPATTTPPPEDTAPGPKPARPLVISGAVLAGVGTALALGGGIGFGVAAGSKSDELDQVQTGGNPEGLEFSDAQALERDGKRFEALQIATAVSGGVIAVVGVALLAVGLRRQRAQRQAAAATWIRPAAAPGFAGVALGGRF